jgi:hypothetical protein
MNRLENSLQEEGPDQEPEAIVSLGAPGVESFRSPGTFMEIIDWSKFNIREMGATAEAAYSVLTGKITNKVDPMTAYAVMQIAVGYITAAGGADLAISKFGPDAAEILKDRLKETAIYKEKIVPRGGNLLRNLAQRGRQASEVRDRLFKRGDHPGEKGEDAAS